MKVEFINLTEEAQEERDYCDALVVKVDGVEVFSVCDGEPEDNNLSRNFSDCYNVVDLMKMAYKAGGNGEGFEVEFIEVEEI